jgi:hypothetical protein
MISSDKIPHLQRVLRGAHDNVKSGYAALHQRGVARSLRWQEIRGSGSCYRASDPGSGARPACQRTHRVRHGGSEPTPGLRPRRAIWRRQAIGAGTRGRARRHDGIHGDPIRLRGLDLRPPNLLQKCGHRDFSATVAWLPATPPAWPPRKRNRYVGVSHHAQRWGCVPGWPPRSH